MRRKIFRARVQRKLQVRGGGLFIETAEGGMFLGQGRAMFIESAGEGFGDFIGQIRVAREYGFHAHGADGVHGLAGISQQRDGVR